MDDLETDENKTTKSCLCKNKYFLVSLAIVVAAVLLAKLMSPPKRILWSEGKATAGVIARVLKEYASDRGENGPYPPTWEDLESFISADDPDSSMDALISENKGNFRKQHFSWEAYYEPNLNPPIEFKIIITRPKDCSKPDAIMLNNKGELFNLGDDGKWVHW